MQAVSYRAILLLAFALLSAAASGKPRRLVQEEGYVTVPADDAFTVAAVDAVAPLQVSQPGPQETFVLPEGFNAAEFVYTTAIRRGPIEGNSAVDAGVSNARGRRPRPFPAKRIKGTPQDQTVAAAAVVTSEASEAPPTTPPAGEIEESPGEVNTAAWCPNPAAKYMSTAENYDACVILARQSNGARIPWCTAFFVKSPGSVSNIALTAGHCVSDSKGTYLLDINNYGSIDRESIICCAYDKSKGSGACPTAYSFKIRSYKLYTSYHKGGWASHDMAVIAAKNSSKVRPGYWQVANWDVDSGKRNWWVYGYPQYDNRFTTCMRDFWGRRWVYGLNGPVIYQPSNLAAYMYGNSCGGLSGGPIYDSRRGAITSVLVASDYNCDSNGWGRINATAIRGVPGTTHLADAWRGVDVYKLWQGF